MPRRLRRLASLSLGILGFLGCPSDDNNGPGPTPATVDRVTVSPAAVDLLVGAQQGLSATALAADGTPIPGKAAAWSSNNTTAATVNATTGLVTAVGAGSAVITAVIDGRTGQATVQVTVPTQRLTVTTSGTGSGTVTSSPAGINCSRAAGVQTGTCAFDFPQGTVVTLTATAAMPEVQFHSWNGANCASLQACQVTMNQPVQVGPRFDRVHLLTIAATGNGAGTISAPEATLTCTWANGQLTSGCFRPLVEGTVVVLTATASPGSQFAGWSGGGCSGTGTCQVTVTQALTVTAMFLGPSTLTVTVNGAGRVTSSPAGIDCQRAEGGAQTGSCSAVFSPGTVVTLNFQGAVNHGFGGWSGSCTGATGACTVTMSVDRAVAAAFHRLWPLTIWSGGPGSGTVTSTPPPVNCVIVNGALTGPACGVVFPAGTVVTLTAVPAEGMGFVGWSGGVCTGTAPCQVTMHQGVQVTAGFAPLVAVTVVTAGNGGGTVTGSPAGINCIRTGGVQSGICGTTYPQGTAVTLTAQAAAGSTFTGWTGEGCSGTGTCVVQATQARTVTATFSLTGGTGLGVGFGPDQFVAISPGTFVMGSNTGFTPEQPAHSVTLTAGYQIQKTEVTQGQWRQVMGTSPSGFSSCGDLCPVENVSWNDVQLFLTALNAQNPGQNYRLPTEAEWEFAARAGTTTDYSGTGVIDQMGWYAANSGNVTHPVAQKLPNAWGLFDVHGNVREWTSNWYEDYTASAKTNPTGPASGAERVLRSGPFNGAASFVRSSVRARFVPSSRDNTTGFRLVKGGAPPAPNPSLTVLISGTGSGTITSTPAGINCVVMGGATSGVCGADFQSGTQVRLDRQLASGTLSAGWDGGCFGNMHCVLTMDAHRSVTAYLIPTSGALGIGFGPEQFVLVNPGTFQMGSANGFPDEPVRSVTITQAFRIQRTEVTQSQWVTIMGGSMTTFSQCFGNCPAWNVSWNQVQAFLAALNAWDPGKNYRLPTEAEWEYAARAGTTGDYGGTGNVNTMAWYDLNSLAAHWPVARKSANAWGLYDMHGNVGEWVRDWYGAYPPGPLTNPTGPASGSWRVFRGGSYSHDAQNVRSSVRHAADPAVPFGNVGFRLIRNP